MACELFNCVPEIKESNESGKFIWKHNCSVKKRNCWITEHEIYKVWNDIYNLFINTKIIKSFEKMVENYLNKKCTVYIPKRRNNTSVCKDIIIKIILDKKNNEIGHFSLTFKNSQLL